MLLSLKKLATKVLPRKVQPQKSAACKSATNRMRPKKCGLQKCGLQKCYLQKLNPKKCDQQERACKMRPSRVPLYLDYRNQTVYPVLCTPKVHNIRLKLFLEVYNRLCLSVCHLSVFLSFCLSVFLSFCLPVLLYTTIYFQCVVTLSE